jgi:hypothetical protein
MIKRHLMFPGYSSLLIAAVLLTSGCATTALNLAEYRPASLAQADVMPSPEQAIGRRTQVVLLDIDDSAVRSRMSDAGLLKMRKLEAVLTDGGVEVVDRALASRLRQEIALAEARGDAQSGYSGPEVAQFAIRAFLTDVGASYRYTQPTEYCDKKGKCTQVLASCNYTGSASGSLRVYELPSLKLLNTFNLRGGASSSTSGGCYDNRVAMTSVARSAVEDAVDDNRVDLQNFFAPKAYVAEKRMRDQKAIFKVMMGRAQGIRSEDKVIFYTVRLTENPLTRRTEREELVIASGLVSDLVAEDHAWIIAEERNRSESVRLGDFVRVQRKKGWFD